MESVKDPVERVRDSLPKSNSLRFFLSVIFVHNMMFMFKYGVLQNRCQACQHDFCSLLIF